jgi:hypothetical protein
VLPDADVDVLERAAGLEVDVDVGAGRDVPTAADGRLDYAVLSGDDLAGGSGRAAGRPDLQSSQDGHHHGDQP